MSRHSEIVTTGAVSIETYVDGDGPTVVVIPSYGRDGGADFDPLTAALAAAGYRVLRPQPGGIARSVGKMSGVVLDDLGTDIAHVIDQLGLGPAVVLGHAFGNFVARNVSTNHPDKVAAVILAANGEGPNGYQWPRMGMMGMMGMMRIVPNPATVPAGQVSFRALNTGWLNHELVVLPLAQGRFPGQRVIGPDGKVDEAGSVGEASRTCGPDKGDEQSSDYGIAPATTGWTTITLPPGRYELICNIAGHYGAGMYAALDVSGPSK